MKIITINVNGLRATCRKGFFTWMLDQAPDAVCMQEIKAHPEQLSQEILQPPGYQAFLNPARRKGYSGVAIYTRKAPDAVHETLGWPDADEQGRFLQADFGALSIVSLYLPSGAAGPERQEAKFDFLDRLLPVLRSLRSQPRHYILCGDWNIAHRKLDLKNWRGNLKNSGFLPEERAWLDSLFNQLGWVDAYRVLHPQREQYTWWSTRGRARENNTGWRIDYQIVSPGLKERIRSASVQQTPVFSDHAPLIIDYDWPSW